jgi:hypothetical protein
VVAPVSGDSTPIGGAFAPERGPTLAAARCRCDGVSCEPAGPVPGSPAPHHFGPYASSERGIRWAQGALDWSSLALEACACWAAREENVDRDSSGAGGVGAEVEVGAAWRT